MEEPGRLMYIYVRDDGTPVEEALAFLPELPPELHYHTTLGPFHGRHIVRYARFHLREALQLMGCKPQHAVHISESVFERLSPCAEEQASTPTVSPTPNACSPPENGSPSPPAPPPLISSVPSVRSVSPTPSSPVSRSRTPYLPTPLPIASPQPHKEEDTRRDCVTLTRLQFLSVVRDTMARCCQYNRLEHLQDFDLACQVKERRRPLIICIAGTSGCGKSTLANLLAGRLGVSTVISTDSLRHMMCTFILRDVEPALHASSYSTGEVIDPALASSHSHAQRVVNGYQKHSALILQHVARIMERCEARREAVIFEGVHLWVDAVIDLMATNRSVILFLVHISNESKHRERFAVRAKYMTLETRHNKYVKYFPNIRLIQDYLCERADHYKIPKIDNTNVDRSLAQMHAVVLECMRKLGKGEGLYDPSTGGVVCPTQSVTEKDSLSWSSVGMLNAIRERTRKDVDERLRGHSFDSGDDDAVLPHPEPTVEGSSSSESDGDTEDDAEVSGSLGSRIVRMPLHTPPP